MHTRGVRPSWPRPPILGVSSSLRLGLALSAAVVSAFASGEPTATAERPALFSRSSSVPIPHRVSRRHSAEDPAVPVSVRTALARPATSARRDGVEWRIEPAALVRVAPSPLRLGIREGLPIAGLAVMTIASDGAVWAGGPGGLVRYTGAEHPRQPVVKASLHSTGDAFRVAALLLPQTLQVLSVVTPGHAGASPVSVQRLTLTTGCWDRWHFFAGRRYLPSDAVLGLAAGDDGSVWVRTAAGLAWLGFEGLTLDEKAERFEARVRARHVRHGLVADSTLAASGDLTTSHQYPNDNDGLWTAIYVAAQSYRYAVTGSAEALDRARTSARALLRLEAITGIPGFPARSFRHRSEPRRADGEWHWTADREWEWKGDTSSDELVGHFYGLSLAHDLLPDQALKGEIRATIARIADHLIGHGLNLVDLDGQPTRWGRYSLEYFRTEEGREEQALRATEMLSHLLVAARVTGEPRFEQEYRRLIAEHRFHERMQTYLANRLELNYSDEELAMLSFEPLFRYERDPALLAAYRSAMAQWWQSIRREDNPLWIYIYARAHTPPEALLDRAAHTLARMPLDLVTWSIRNGHRLDVPHAPDVDRHGRPQTTRLLAPDERRVQKWNGNPFELDGGSGGLGEDDGAAYLVPYWMGRWAGFLR